MTQVQVVPARPRPDPAASPTTKVTWPLPDSGSAAWPMDPVTAYWLDAGQRWLLMLDALRQRGNNALEYSARAAPHVLSFEFELVMDGRDLERPVNYGLVRIIPPPGTAVDEARRPFVIFDPRAGHGPGIAGMKNDSEIGEVLAAGHPCYFVGFVPDPVPGQTIEDVCRAEARFVETVTARHPLAQGKPVLIGNCQAGWQVMMTAAIRPDLPGPILLAGSPLSYWAGIRGHSPCAISAACSAAPGSTSLAGDLGGGIFDGASLVANFEAMHPDNTYWKKLYDVYSKIDTEAPRFLEFEKWWGSPVLTNAEEMQYITDNLFVGNRLSTGQLRTIDGLRVDLRNISLSNPRLLLAGVTTSPRRPGARLDLDLYETKRRDRLQWPDHRLLAAPERRPSRRLRLRQGGNEAVPGVRAVHGPGRTHAAGPLRGRHHRCERQDRQSTTRQRAISLQPGAALAGRCPGDRSAQSGR